MRKHSISILSIAVFIMVVLNASAFAFKLPDTGQTKCYTNTYPFSEVSCAGTGQDGAYNMNPLLYTDNNNGTVTDNNTALMWQKGESTSSMVWASAVSYCNGLSLGGYTDWRLPTEKELGSLIDYSIANPGPMIRTTYFPNAKKYYYWSSTAFAGNSSLAWNVLFSEGLENYFNKSFSYNPRCVRGSATDTNDFHDNGNGTVTDRSTGLIWQQSGVGPAMWSSAVSSCESLVLGNAADWRLPNVRELVSLTDHAVYYPASTATFWSSTSYTLFPDHAWVVSYSDGQVKHMNKLISSYYFRCVRGQSLRSDLIVSNTDSPDPVQTGQPLTYTVRVTNNGPDTASGVFLIDNLPNGSVFVSASPTQGSCSHSSGKVTCSIGSMTNASVVTVAIVVNAPAATGTMTNSASATSASIDPNSANSTSTATTTVVSSIIQLSAASYTVNENSGILTVRATRTGSSIGSAGVSYATANGTATAGFDYVTSNGTLTWTNGDTADKTFIVTIMNDLSGEADETFTVTLSSPTGDAALGTPVAATVTILDDDPVVTVTSTDSTATEAGPTTGQFTVTRTGITTSPLTVYFTVSGTATYGNDYAAIGTSVTIPASEASSTITLTPIDDTMIEANETVLLTLSADASYTVGSPSSAVVTIISDDSYGTIRLSASAYTVDENAGTVTITAMRTGGSIGAVGISYATSSGTATAGSDYTSASGTLSWPEGDTADKTFAVLIIDDLFGEMNETFTVALSSPTGGAVLGTPNTAAVTIRDNEPVVGITASVPAATEAGPAAGQFTVTRTGVTTSPLTVNYAVSGTAISDIDYSAIGTSIIIPAGASAAIITVTPIDDSQYELNETVIVTLATDLSYTVGTSNSAVVTIVSDDPEPAAYYDHFNDNTYSDRWTVSESGMITMAESGTVLSVQITKPGTGCSHVNLMSIPTFNGQNLVIETGVAFKGGGEMFLRLRRDDDNFVQVGLNIGELPDVALGSAEAGVYTEQLINVAGPYYLKKKAYKNKTFTLIKTGDYFDLYLNGVQIGLPVANLGVGDTGLAIELLNNSCSTDAKGPKTSFDYVFIKEPLTDNAPSATVTLITPNGGQSIAAGSLFLIEWTAPAEAVNFTIEYSTNSGAKWKVLDAGVQGNAYVWKLSKVKPLSTYLLRVTGYNASGIAVGSDVSDAVFSVLP